MAAIIGGGLGTWVGTLTRSLALSSGRRLRAADLSPDMVDTTKIRGPMGEPLTGGIPRVVLMTPEATPWSDRTTDGRTAAARMVDVRQGQNRRPAPTPAAQSLRDQRQPLRDERQGGRDDRQDGRLGLVLGSGAGRGWAHIGVLRALAKAGIVPDIVVGTSIGAVVGGCYVADELDAVESFARGLTRRSMLSFLDINFSGAGLISGNRLVEQLDTRLRHFDIERLPTKFVAVATEIGTGQEIWLSRGRLVDAMRASYAMPGIFKPVEMGGRWLFDGALVNPVPVSVARALGARYVIAVNLNTDMSGRGSFAPIEPAIEATASREPESMAIDRTGATNLGGVVQRNGRALRKLVQRQLFGEPHQGPSITTVMSEAMNIVQDRIARSRLAGDPPDAVIAPRLGDFGLFDFHRADSLIQHGEAAANRALEDIQREIAVRRAHGILR